MKESHHTNPAAKAEHGSITSYVIGFVLSIIFTIIPYHLVVNKVLTGNVLLAAILVIAVWQMIIQLVFFLHLGRGPKPLYNVVFFFATAGVVVITIAASLFIMANLYRTMSPQEFVIRQSQEENIAQINGKETGACTELRNNHAIVISGAVQSLGVISAERCDTLTFINEGKTAHEIAFGTHPEDTSYGGLFEVHVDAGKSEVVTLNEVGNFTFHDHSNDNIFGSLSVQQRSQ